jgi:alkanesulfonate monooxygenase SsuD/methylene tetrahydromethanopterin reductase-like flavin-dependent oxidoreductase (luciferase family)
MRIGFFLATEEYAPHELLAQARAAEEAGFHGLWVSDHYHSDNQLATIELDGRRARMKLEKTRGEPNSDERRLETVFERALA